MKRPARSLIIVFSVFLCLVLVSGCLGEKRQSTADKTYKAIRFGYIMSDQLHSPAVMVMKEKKLLEAAGIGVEWIEYQTGAYAMTDMMGGSLAFACTGCVPVISAHAESGGLAIIAGSNQEGSSLVVKEDIKTVADLAGKKIATPGVGSIQDLLLEMLAFDNGIKIKNVAMKVSEMPLFLKNGEVDGFLAWAPHPTSAAISGSGYEILSAGTVLPGYQCCVLSTTENMVRDDPETVRQLMKVYLEAYQWFLDNMEESIKMLSSVTGVAEDVIREAMNTVSYPEAPYCNLDSMQIMTKNLIEAGKITNVKQPETEPFLEGLYKPELLNENN